MKKLILSVGLFLMGPGSAFAGTQWEIRGKIYDVDTVSHEAAGPGTTLTKLVLSGPDSQNIFYTTTDLTDENVGVRVVKGKETAKGLETLSSMAARCSAGGEDCFIGVNSDFFERWPDSYPVGSVIVDGEVISMLNKDWSAFGITGDKKVYAGNMSFTGSVSSENAGVCALDAVNRGGLENSLVLYSSRLGDNTGTGAFAADILLEPVEGVLTPDSSVKMKVVSDSDPRGGMDIPANGYVLSGSGKAAEYVTKLQKGEIVEIAIQTAFDGKPVENIRHAVGGHPMILSEGRVLDTDTAIVNLPKLNPRTAVGFNADGTRLVLMVVDGRSKVAAGVISKQLAEIMRHVGCTEAMNFDGGGSSEMYSTENGIINRPSDGRERPVSDALFLVAPKK